MTRSAGDLKPTAREELNLPNDHVSEHGSRSPPIRAELTTAPPDTLIAIPRFLTQRYDEKIKPLSLEGYLVTQKEITNIASLE